MRSVFTIAFIVYEILKLKAIKEERAVNVMGLSTTMIDIVYYIYLFSNLFARTTSVVLPSLCILLMGLCSPLFKTSKKSYIIDSLITIGLLCIIL